MDEKSKAFFEDDDSAPITRLGEDSDDSDDEEQIARLPPLPSPDDSR